MHCQVLIHQQRIIARFGGRNCFSRLECIWSSYFKIITCGQRSGSQQVWNFFIQSSRRNFRWSNKSNRQIQITSLTCFPCCQKMCQWFQSQNCYSQQSIIKTLPYKVQTSGKNQHAIVNWAQIAIYAQQNQDSAKMLLKECQNHYQILCAQQRCCRSRDTMYWNFLCESSLCRFIVS
ncbi:unnamed protein product [Paramecium sonneborni]|uniref:Uncharacterized protein n=1 Tax=Paramecium sonneborni TaxID=65129 RepID=A0A8S1RV18_9CILI|nr:unnamed protein product [Paramecium sonneborni]